MGMQKFKSIFASKSVTTVSRSETGVQGPGTENFITSSMKGLVRTGLGSYFAFTPGIPRTLNISRVFNSYLTILDFVVVILLNTVYSWPPLKSVNLALTALFALSPVAYSLLRLGLGLVYIVYMLAMKSAIFGFLVYFLVIMAGYLLNLWTLCGIVQDYSKSGKKYPEADSVCSTVLTSYIYFSIFLALMVVMKLICLFLAYRAYKFEKIRHDGK
eukprot:TRINITY_DN8659_c0_g1_i1.p1 TRINITY_DN8659_c0_g1~~TRINITY_DN8659_c0_g1_i1.p1  ORF type:complete len:215 (+),score=29.87 TRINITY_DN8659_c0_g1_i1:98-742(+)